MLIGFDPGKNTGFVVFDEAVFKLEQAGQVLIDDVPNLLRDLQHPTAIIVEAFRLYPWRSEGLSWNSLPAVQVIGQIKAWGVEHGVGVNEQPASVRKTISNDMVKAFGLWRPTVRQPHARDAARHILWYCKKHYPNKFIKVLKERGVLDAGTRKGCTATGGAV